MNSIIKQALQLSREEKLELLYALQEEQEMENDEDFLGWANRRIEKAW